MPRTEDRRRKGATGGFRRKLVLDTSKLDPAYDYRWANDDGMRLHDLTQKDDWDLVPDPSKSVKQDGTDLGSAISTVVGKDATGQPIRGYLVRKHKSFVEQDMLEKRERVDRLMRTMGAEARANVPNSYGDGITVEDGSKR